MSSERKHHDFGCSKWPDLLRCADYKSTGGSSPAAERGTRIHKYWELIGTNQDLPEGADPEEVANAAWAAGVVDSLADAANVEWEQEINSETPEYFGYLDACWYKDPKTIVIADGKSGQGNEEQWIQLVGYANAMIQEDDNIERCILHFIYWDKRSLRTYEFSRDEVLNEVKKLLHHISTGTRNTGVQCGRCAHYETCGQVQGILLRTWQTDWAGVWNSPDSLGEIMDDLSFLENMKKRASSRIKELIAEGVEVSGYKVYDRKGSSKVDTLKAWEDLKETMSADDFLKCCSVNLKALQSTFQLRTGEELSGEFIIPGKPSQTLTKSRK